MPNLLKAIKTVAKGYPTKCKQTIALSADTLQYHNSEQSIALYLIPDYSRDLVEFDSIAEFELAGIADSLEVGESSLPSYLPISAEEWQSVAWTSLATDNASTRYALGGVCFAGNSVVATDSRRLHGSSLESDFGGDDLRQIVPMACVAAIAELIKIFREKTVYACFGGDSVEIFGSCWKYTSRLIEGRFPNWQQVIPSKSEYRKEILDTAPIRAECEATIKRVKLENKVNYAKLTDKAERKAWVEGIPTIRVQNVLLDCRYVLDAIGKLNFVEFWQHERFPSNHAVQFESGSRYSVVMSIREERTKKPAE